MVNIALYFKYLMHFLLSTGLTEISDRYSAQPDFPFGIRYLWTSGDFASLTYVNQITKQRNIGRFQDAILFYSYREKKFNFIIVAVA